MPVAAKPGQPARTDHEYERNGTANLFMMFAPLEGGRQVKVTDRHAAIDYAPMLKELSDAHFPGAAKVVLVQDNLSTHKHGSWLDMAEAELSVLSRQCLNRRIPNKPTLTGEVAACQDSRNKKNAKANWQSTTANASTKLKQLSPAM